MSLCILAVPAVAFVAGSVPGWRAYSAAQRQAVELLSAAESAEQRVAAAGHLGDVLTIRDGGWIAVRYTDSHHWPGYFSCAVARCSDGKWFRSSRHFCGAFGGHRQCREQVEQCSSLVGTELRESFEKSLRESEFSSVEFANDLGTAERALEGLGFSEFSPD